MNRRCKRIAASAAFAFVILLLGLTPLTAVRTNGFVGTTAAAKPVAAPLAGVPVRVSMSFACEKTTGGKDSLVVVATTGVRRRVGADDEFVSRQVWSGEIGAGETLSMGGKEWPLWSGSLAPGERAITKVAVFNTARTDFKGPFAFVANVARMAGVAACAVGGNIACSAELERVDVNKMVGDACANDFCEVGHDFIGSFEVHFKNNGPAEANGGHFEWHVYPTGEAVSDGPRLKLRGGGSSYFPGVFQNGYSIPLG